MKSFVLLAAFLLMCSVASAQVVQKGDTCANCTPERSGVSNERAEADRRAQELAKHNEWPGRPSVARSRPLNYRVFTTNFLVNNESDKEIRQIKWTATLVNRETREMIGTFPLSTKKTIRPHKSKRLKERVFVPLKKLLGPTVSAGNPTDPQKAVELDEKYEIVEIVYKDKSVARP